MGPLGLALQLYFTRSGLQYFTASSPAASAAVEGGADTAAAGETASSSKEHAPAINIALPAEVAKPDEPLAGGYARGDRVEVFWEEAKTSDSAWYSGTITNVGTSRVRSKGRLLTVPDIQVRYDQRNSDDDLFTHSLHNTAVRYATEPSLQSLLDARELPTVEQEWNAAYGAVQAFDPRIPTIDDQDVESSTGQLFTVVDFHVDLETGEVLNTSAMFAVDNDGKLLRAASLDKVHARYWHTPANEREFNMSPQRALWKTAKELKWDEYMKLEMFEWVLLSEVDQKQHRSRTQARLSALEQTLILQFQSSAHCKSFGSSKARRFHFILTPRRRCSLRHPTQRSRNPFG